MDKFIKDKIKVTYEKLEKLSEKIFIEIKDMKYIPCEYKKNNDLPEVTSDWGDFGRDDRVKGRDSHFWFYTEFKTPGVTENEQVFFELTTGRENEWDAVNPQGILYLNGEMAQGLDMNHRKVLLKPNTSYKAYLYFYVGMIEAFSDVKANIKTRDTKVFDLYYDLKIPYEASLCFREDEYASVNTLKHLNIACNMLDFSDIYSKEFYESIDNASKYLKEEYFQKVCGNSDVIVNYVGHTHIDVAWMWTYAQTKEKAQRSFSTVLALMDRYPEYIFMSSQPQLYEYFKEEIPELYEKLKEKVREGRWEVDGAMWLEADCNLSSGESLVRQIMYGKKFMKDEFGVDSEILWLPDVFGYSAALPQILKKTGVDKFVTSKISWSEFNVMPYDTFFWEGIDGTEIFTYFLTAQNHSHYVTKYNYTTYNGEVTPEMHLGAWERYQQKDYNNETIISFGWGDGGGGPTEEMLETYRRLEYGLPNMPKAQMSRAGDFLNRVEKNFNENCRVNRRTPKWVGELYLELHRGTYTSIGKNKKNNRECEFLCQNAETASVVDAILLGGKYPSQTFFDAWKTILLNQFHDVIPGSSIEEVYADSDKQYAKVRDDVGEILDNKIENLAQNIGKDGIMVYNPNSFVASGYVNYNGELIYAENIPSMGYKVIDRTDDNESVSIFENKLESKHYIIHFDDNYTITSIFDKDNNREITSGKANILRAFEDEPRAWDNWEVTNYYKDKYVDITDVSSVDAICGNGFGGFKIVRNHKNSTITQNIKIYNKSRRIDFETEVDWHEHHTLLKSIFPVDIHSDKATYDIQFGSLERPTHENTTWDKAKFEVCAHKWIDLSEEGYGVSVLNDCKYGHSVLGNEMTITLIKSGTDPNPNADQGEHKFTYSLYPHNDGFKKGGTINEAYLLNRPMIAKKTQGIGGLEDKYSLITCDAQNIIIETVKKAENANAVVVRLYDAWNKKSDVTLNLGFKSKKISLCDMLENQIEEIGKGDSINLRVKNFEIVTLLLEI